MSRRYPTPVDVIDCLRDLMHDYHDERRPLFAARKLTAIARQPGPAFMDTRFFDMTLDNGRIYRVRVSDITPEEARPNKRQKCLP